MKSMKNMVVSANSFSAVIVTWIFCAGSAMGQSYWVGHLKTPEFKFSVKTIEMPEEEAGKRYHSADLTTYTYDIYQNPSGLVRHQLASISRQRGFEPLDVQMFNYPEGYMISFNKGAKTAFKAPMPIPGGRSGPLESRSILGHKCKGEVTNWKNQNGYSVEIKTWTARDSDFRHPLLKVITVTDLEGHLGRLQIEAVTRIEKAPSTLDDSLFRLPPGLNISNLR